jgi:hypothetical protein
MRSGPDRESKEREMRHPSKEVRTQKASIEIEGMNFTSGSGAS